MHHIRRNVEAFDKDIDALDTLDSAYGNHAAQMEYGHGNPVSRMFPLFVTRGTANSSLSMSEPGVGLNALNSNIPIAGSMQRVDSISTIRMPEKYYPALPRHQVISSCWPAPGRPCLPLTAGHRFGTL